MRIVVSSIVLACLVVTAAPASAEWFADIFVGRSFTESQDVTTRSAQGVSHFRDVDLDASFGWGGRFGHYFDAAPFIGLGVDVFSFSPRIGPQQVRVDGCVPSGGCGGGTGGTNGIDIDSLAISLDLFLRVPLLRSKQAPWGALQPYVTAGAPLFITTVTPRTSVQFRNHDDDTDYSFGYKVGGGLAVQVARNLMLFGEYRYTHVEASVDELASATTGRNASLRTDLDSHSVLLGLGARW